MNNYNVHSLNLVFRYSTILSIIFFSLNIFPQTINYQNTSQTFNDLNFIDIKTSKEDSFKLKPIKKQEIEFGQSFSPIMLNSYIESRQRDLKVVWSVSGNKHLAVEIDTLQTANFYPKDSNWYGCDTITFSALINDSIFLSTQTTFAIKPPPFYDREPIRPIKNILLTGVNDFISLATNPVRWDSTDFIKLPIIIVGTYFFMVSDENMHKWISDDGRAKPNPIMDFGTIYGKSITSQLAALGFGLYGLAFHKKEFLQIGLEIYESCFIANNITAVLKRSFGRHRPYENKGPYDFTPFPNRKNPLNSFPSGHSTLAFSLSSVVASHVKDPLLKILIYTPAVITAISRVYNNYHWFSDVFMGSAVGYFVGTFLVSRHQHILNKKLTIGMDGAGRLSLRINF